MSKLSVGLLVQHASLGVGKIVALDGNSVHVFFPGNDRRHAAKFQLAMASTHLKSDGVPEDEWLAGLDSFTLDPALGRYARAANWVSHEQAIASFAAKHPAAFAPGASAGPAARCLAWRAAGAEWAALVSGGAAAKLLADGEIAELARRAARVGRHLASVPAALDADVLEAAFRDEAGAAAFFDALLSVHSVPSPARARFERLFAATAALDLEPALAWPVATVFPFLVSPGRSVFLSPKTASAGAERLGNNLRLTPAPAWMPYAALRTLALKLLRGLEPLGARDLVDVEAFLYAVATDRTRGPARAAGAEGAAPAKRARAAKKA